MLTRDEIGGHHLLSVHGKGLPFPACVQDAGGRMLYVREINLIQHEQFQGIQAFRIVWESSWPKPAAWCSMTQVKNINLMSLDDAAYTLQSVFRSAARWALGEYRASLKGVGAPKWLRRARKHQRRR